ncbi:hypothetical protein L496_1804 [Bordetella holmesii CDC-H572-BH]|nr:hypothetical protein L496_1804 [Bordetella holmesii CDC-H572-BH]KCV06645.1 hypothetical protein L498_0646 [Bordetella holmesii CDC-H629-BH]SUV95598.1 Uncharacterised protein [Bordetella holmesii]
MDPWVNQVLQGYQTRMDQERALPRTEPPGGRDGGHDQRMRATGAQTGDVDFVCVDLWKERPMPEPCAPSPAHRACCCLLAPESRSAAICRPDCRLTQKKAALQAAASGCFGDV